MEGIVENALGYMKFMGSKRRALPALHGIMEGFDGMGWTYCEPFLGSGAMFFNLPTRFDRCVLADARPEMTLLFRALPRLTARFIEGAAEWERKNYNIKESKEGYYRLRALFNMSRVNPLIPAEKVFMMFWMLANTCMNGMVRLGPNGFNQAYGRKSYQLEGLAECVEYAKRQEHRALAADFREVFRMRREKPEKRVLWFCDPPYYLHPMHTCEWAEMDTACLVERLAAGGDPFIYTDTFTGNKWLQWLVKRTGAKVVPLDTARNVRPGRDRRDHGNPMDEVAVFRL